MKTTSGAETRIPTGALAFAEIQVRIAVLTGHVAPGMPFTEAVGQARWSDDGGGSARSRQRAEILAMG